MKLLIFSTHLWWSLQPLFFCLWFSRLWPAIADHRNKRALVGGDAVYLLLNSHDPCEAFPKSSAWECILSLIPTGLIESSLLIGLLKSAKQIEYYIYGKSFCIFMLPVPYHYLFFLNDTPRDIPLWENNRLIPIIFTNFWLNSLEIV